MGKECIMNESDKRESMRIDIVCADADFLWVNDYAIDGLYAIDRLTFKVKNILNSSQLFKYERFKIMSIFSWKGEIVIVPDELNKKWIFYNKKTNEVQYRNIIELKSRTVGICIVEEQGILLPASSKDPIFIVDLKTMTCIRVITDWMRNILKEDTILSSIIGIVAGKNVFFHLYNTKWIFNIGSKCIDKYEINIPNEICSISCCDNKIWILPIKGNYIYAMDAEGKILDKYEMTVNGKSFSASDFIRIIATERYVFILPNLIDRIYIYDTKKEYFCQINIKKDILNNTLPLQVKVVPYWGYHVERGKLYLLPLGSKLLIIDLETLEYKKEDVFLPDIIAGKNLGYWYGWNQWFGKDAAMGEINEKSLKLYLELMENDIVDPLMKELLIGRNIWRNVQL